MRRTITALAALAVALLPATEAAAGPPDLTEVELTVATSDGQRLPATLRIPADAPGPLPGMVLLHGAGAHPRADLQQEGEAFARAGVATLVYDKRAAGYSLTDRSYPRLAEDAITAMALLRTRPEIDSAQVGVWGFSEGGWVAPLAAEQDPEAAFLVVVGANGVAPLRQQAWAEASTLYAKGVRGSLLDAASRTTYRMINGMGMFPEPYYDPGPPLRSLRLPVLGIWGEKDRLTPPVESVDAYRAALDAAGNPHYTLRTVAGGDHRVRTTATGWDRGAELVPGYVELVGSWVTDVASGRAPATSVEGAGDQPRPTADMPPLAWYESAWLQGAALIVMLVGFAGFGLVAAWRRLRGHLARAAGWPARLLAGGGLVAVVGGLAYVGFAVVASRERLDLGPLLAGRPPLWLLLQVLAVAVVAALLVLGWRWRQAAGDRARIVSLLVAGVVFVPWALGWGLLVP